MIVSHPRCTFQGSYVALPTPFREGRIDPAALKTLIEFHVARKTDGFVVCGTTGEAATLSDNERRSVVETTVALVRGRLPVIAGVGTNCTRTTVEHARFAAGSGVAALLVVTPYYNKPSPRGLVSHFSAIAEAVEMPIVLYNVPSRTGVDMSPEVVAEIGRRHHNVVAVKEALPSLERVKRLVGETPVGVLCGDDASIADFMSLGALGVIGVVNNVVPEKVAELVRTAIPGKNSVRAAELVEYLRPLTRDLFIESNPVPVKAALAMMLSNVHDEVRLPLAPLEESSRKQLRTTMQACGLL
jgi:4-hydroxy-tetrahydrodipicolinate synthase